MGANPRTKGQSGEREVAAMLNAIIHQAMVDSGYPEEQCNKALTSVQRNQNQSAVGGNDLSNCMGLSIEIKRQEQLSVNTWWAQCLAAAERNTEMPVLMYRQNNKPWRIRTHAWVALLDGTHMQAVVEFDVDTFKLWFRKWTDAYLASGQEIRA